MTSCPCCVRKPHRRLLAGRPTLAAALALLLASNGVIAGEARFATSFETGEPVPTAAQAGAARVSLGEGPAQPYVAKAGMGYTGDRALNYRASAAGRVPLFTVDIEVEKDTVLSWMALPEIVAGDTAASTGVSVDLVFDDGRRLSDLAVTDQHGARVTAAGQAASMTLYPQQWARKQVRLGEVAALRGKRIRAIELQLQPGSGGEAVGWIDDIAIDRLAAPGNRSPTARSRGATTSLLRRCRMASTSGCRSRTRAR